LFLCSSESLSQGDGIDWGFCLADESLVASWVGPELDHNLSA
jgi:hypothetical protein